MVTAYELLVLLDAVEFINTEEELELVEEFVAALEDVSAVVPVIDAVVTSEDVLLDVHQVVEVAPEVPLVVAAA